MTIPGEKVLAGATAVSVKVIARVLMISERQVQNLANDGIIERTETRRYNLEKAVQGYIQFLKGRTIGANKTDDDVADYHTEKARLVKHQADRAELEVKELSGDLLRASEVNQTWYQMVTHCKTRLLSIPSKAAPIVAAESNAGAVQEILEDLVREALEELSDYANSERSETIDARDDSMEATTKTKRK